MREAFFAYAIQTKNAFWNVSKWFFLVNEMGMVFFYAILAEFINLKQRREAVWSIHTWASQA
ncbi:hypothetical protein [Paenibacillus kribbensis]|uniref:Uncharacterized protein n=1 Tax=Paenibacillus kribbensis TaxID=172713 RepID=A0A222WPE0_9BACL|nr:hypothetical protein [Paenibacillus kribbensis]ASR47804.1 hypothetical protein B4V02_14505 [Paenibacillus kribbensis]